MQLPEADLRSGHQTVVPGDYIILLQLFLGPRVGSILGGN